MDVTEKLKFLKRRKSKLKLSEILEYNKWIKQFTYFKTINDKFYKFHL